MQRVDSSRIPWEWKKLEYLSATKVLTQLRQIAACGLLDGQPYEVASLRRHDLQHLLEARQAALFCYGIGRAIGSEVSFAMLEKADYDFVACFKNHDRQCFVPVQLKELVPTRLNPNAQLQDILDKVGRTLFDSHDLAVAIHINRDITGFRPSGLRLPRNIGELWLFGAKDPTQERWCLIGDLLTEPSSVRDFNYPAPRSLHWVHKPPGGFSQE